MEHLHHLRCAPSSFLCVFVLMCLNQWAGTKLRSCEHVQTAALSSSTSCPATRTSHTSARVSIFLLSTAFSQAGKLYVEHIASVCAGAFFFVRSLLLHVNPKEQDHPFVAAWTGWALAAGFFCAATLWGKRTPSL